MPGGGEGSAARRDGKCLSHPRNPVQAVNYGLILLIAIRAFVGGGRESVWESQSRLSRPVSKKSEEKQELATRTL